MAAQEKRSSRNTGSRRAETKRQGQRPGPASGKSIVLGVALVLFSLLAWRKLRNPAPPPPMAAKAETEEPRIISSNKQLQQAQTASSERSLLMVQERAAGLTPLPVKKNGRGALELVIRSRAFVRGCTLSDLDIMKRDQEILKHPDPAFVLSVERLDPGNVQKPQQIPVTVEQLKKGLQHTFSIPVDQKRGTWGIFLCTAGRDSTCQRQLKTSLNDLGILQSEVLTQQKPLAAYPAQDKVFFFHFMVAYQDRLLLHDSMQSLDSSFERLEAALKKGGGEPVSPALMKQAKKWLWTIGSLPALVHGPVLELQLPHRGDRCL